MTTFEQIDAAIATKGIRYDAVDELFYDGNRPLELDEILTIVGAVTLDELASYQNDKSDHSPAARNIAQFFRHTWRERRKNAEA